MGARLRSWWQQIKQHRVAIVFVAVLVVAIALILVEVRVYGTGFTGKTLWDWQQLLIIPAVLAVGGYLFTYTTSRNDRAATEKRTQAERDIALDNQREQALQVYIDSMSELLLEKKLRDSQPGDEVRKIARVRTLTMLPRLDAVRKGSVLQFLYESGLIEKGTSVIDLSGADLSGATLSGTTLSEANLIRAILNVADLSEATISEADLSEATFIKAKLNRANLSGASLYRADLSGASLRRVNLSAANLIGAMLFEADLSNADLSNANLSGAYLSNADLKGAKVTTEQLGKAWSIQGTIMPDGTKHP